MHIHDLNDGLMHIHDLNDDVMLRVFGWLTLIERIQSEKGTVSYLKGHYG